MSDPLNSPLAKLYRAGRQQIPAQSAVISRASTRLYGAMETLDREAARAGDPVLLTTMLEIGTELVRAMRQGVLALDNGAEAVLRSADLLRVSDDEASRDFDRLRRATPGVDYTPLGEHHLPRHELPPALPDREEAGRRFDTPGAAGTPGGPISVPGSPDVAPSRTGQGDFQVPDVRTTPAPADPDVDRRERAEVERRDRDDNPLRLPRADAPVPTDDTP